jgi:hypothetical protein
VSPLTGPPTATALAQRPAAVIVAAADGPLLPTYVTRDLARVIINVAETTLPCCCLKPSGNGGGGVTEVLRLRLSGPGRSGGCAATNLTQRRSSQQHTLVYISPELQPQPRAFATDARLGSSSAHAGATPSP